MQNFCKPINRKQTSPIFLGGVQIGGGAPIVVQSMTNTPTEAVQPTVQQIRRLAAAGAEVVRIAVNTERAAAALPQIRRAIGDFPLVADIHFDYRLALAALAHGIQGLRINPGNLKRPQHIAAVIEAAKAHNVPIRIGVNAGSLERRFFSASGRLTAQALVDAALEHVNHLARYNYAQFKVSVKASDPLLTVEAYRKLSTLIAQPLHLGVTEAGSVRAGTIKSTVALGILLAEGIGDTLRISLAADPVEEVKVAYGLLQALRLRRRGINWIACPTCARQEFDVIGTIEALEARFEKVSTPLDVSIIGCCVNGHGEAVHCDIGVVGSNGGCIYYEKGQRSNERFSQEALVEKLTDKVEQMLHSKQSKGDGV